VEVKMIDQLADPACPKEALFGYWNPMLRVILIRTGMDPAATLQTLWHERVHMILSDAGVKLRQKDEEAVADSIATAIVAELLAR
jgi:Zn-dependent peptidase ImmA (M78 family)